MKIIGGLFGAGGSHVCAHVKVVEHEAAKGRSHVLEKLKEFEELGGEGVMLRKPKSCVTFQFCERELGLADLVHKGCMKERGQAR